MFCIICKLVESVLLPTSQVVEIMLILTCIGPLGYKTSDWPPAALCTAGYKSSSQAFNPPQLFLQLILHPFVYKGCHGREHQSLANFTGSLLSPHLPSQHVITEDAQSGQVISPF